MIFFSFSLGVDVVVNYLGSGKYHMTVDGKTYEVSGFMVQENNVCNLTCSVNGSVSRSRVVVGNREVHLFTAVRITYTICLYEIVL